MPGALSLPVAEDGAKKKFCSGALNRALKCNNAFVKGSTFTLLALRTWHLLRVSMNGPLNNMISSESPMAAELAERVTVALAPIERVVDEELLSDPDAKLWIRTNALLSNQTSGPSRERDALVLEASPLRRGPMRIGSRARSDHIGCRRRFCVVTF